MCSSDLTGLTTGKGVSAIVGLVAATATFVALRARGVAGFRLAAILTTFSLFLVGSQAFANYYHLIGAMILVHLAAARPADDAPAAAA